MGKDLLAQDYILKQLSSSLTHPETELGQEFWFNTGDTDNLSKIWIVSDKAQVIENNSIAVINESSLRVETEDGHKNILIPQIEKDVNHGKNFAKLRQIYNSFILASWFKKKLENSIYKYYIDQNKVDGIDLADKNAKRKIYELYCQAFKKGVYDYIKKDYDSNTNQKVKRHYFSGGVKLQNKVSSSVGDISLALAGVNVITKAVKLGVSSSSLEDLEEDMKKLNNNVSSALHNTSDKENLDGVKEKLLTLRENFKALRTRVIKESMSVYTAGQVRRKMAIIKNSIEGLEEYEWYLEKAIEEIGKDKVSSAMSRKEVSEKIISQVEALYARQGVKKDDYDLEPIVAKDDQDNSIGTIQDGDKLFTINHRPDRIMALTDLVTSVEFNARGNRFDPPEAKVDFVPFATYDPKIFKERGIQAAFELDIPEYTSLSQAMVAAGIEQYRGAESDKGSHVTKFWDGRKIEVAEYAKDGITVNVVPSSKLPDKQKPAEMQYAEVAQNAVDYMDSKIGSDKQQFVVVNLATDIQGHIIDGRKAQGIKTVLETDKALAKLRNKVKEMDGVLIFTADHGNLEEMVVLGDNGNPLTDEYGSIPSKQHTNGNPVAFGVEGLGDVKLKQDGGLSNVGATVLDIMGVPLAEGMAESLLEDYEKQDIKGPVVLVILDGWGEKQNHTPESLEWDAINLAQPPVYNELKKTSPWTLLQTHGSAVGLPDYQMGDSDNGHRTMGAGRILPTLYGEIMRQIETGEFYDNPVLRAQIQDAIDNEKDLNIAGLMSGGGVHSDYKYVLAMLKLAKQMGVEEAGLNINIHAFLDGRDVQTRIPTQSGAFYLKKIMKEAESLGLNNVLIASVMGRHYGMDRDAYNRDAAGNYEQSGSLWQERFKPAVDAMFDAGQRNRALNATAEKQMQRSGVGYPKKGSAMHPSLNKGSDDESSSNIINGGIKLNSDSIEVDMQEAAVFNLPLETVDAFKNGSGLRILTIEDGADISELLN